ncbi:MAG: DUF167 domain-containing protein [Candidatus Pacebacteria bacterium]|jgi:uncharacterized protein YggU (UPF0235/DUF167 family)|nr:DUF167 domain-containing protein [Candidatus Paceibacterota bacterium]NMB47241.1 DUF167 domain-containing protein [Patescibacteria group bacterium]MDD2796507.1 DUF167 domain-containing protein [Candidatus Paceibacterota bacterium]MDD3047958.1 DUF167 domain-containing protein [Candidatus Paceibacterota bacterium]MDD3510176.1 DUF167 domain-containing protein [Candidatus Paceibacterota bacterium]
MLIKVKCYPKSKKELLNKKDENSFEIFLKEKPERGEANKRIFEILAEYFSISKKRIKLIKGAKTQNKIFEIYDK